MASDWGQNRYSDFVALETLLRFENCSSSHCLLSSWRRFHVFESSHPSFHRTVFFELLSVVFVASVPCLRVVASLVSSYCFLQVIVCCLRGVGSMSSSRRIPRFIVLFSSSHCLLPSWRRFHVFESSHPSFHRTVFFESLSVVFVASVPCLRVVASLVSSYRILRGTAVSSLRRFYVFVSSGCA